LEGFNKHTGVKMKLRTVLAIFLLMPGSFLIVTIMIAMISNFLGIPALLVAGLMSIIGAVLLLKD
jgi:hypothetical protein